LAQLLVVWRAALVELAPFESGSTLVEARSVLDKANAQRRYPADRSALIHDLVASALLHRALARGLGSPDETAEASYLLELASCATTRRAVCPGRGLSGDAIRAAPNTDIARMPTACSRSRPCSAGWDRLGSLPRDVEWLASCACSQA
jgi:hypothetical protein